MINQNIVITQSFSDEDIKNLCQRMTNSEEKMKFLNEYQSGNGIKDKDELENNIKGMRSNCWFIRDNEKNIDVGFIALYNSILVDCGLLVYLDKDYSNKGYVKFAFPLFLTAISGKFSKLESYVITAETHKDNVSIQKILENNGFVLKDNGPVLKIYKLVINSKN